MLINKLNLVDFLDCSVAGYGEYDNFFEMETSTTNNRLDIKEFCIVQLVLQMEEPSRSTKLGWHQKVQEMKRLHSSSRKRTLSIPHSLPPDKAFSFFLCTSTQSNSVYSSVSLSCSTFFIAPDNQRRQGVEFFLRNLACCFAGVVFWETLFTFEKLCCRWLWS